MTSDLTAREISDRLRINDLLVTYAAALDARDWDLVRTVFTDDAVLDYSVFGGPRGTVDEAVEWLSKTLGKVPMTQHIISNVRIELSDDTADVSSIVFNPLGTGSGVILVGGTYTDRLRRTDAGWLIAKRKAEFTWSDKPIRRPD